MEEGDERQVSKFSSGINIILRIDELWKDTHRHSRAGLYNKWNSDLDRIWLELARDIKQEDYKDKEREFNEFDLKLESYGKIRDTEPEGFKKVSDEEIKIRNSHYKTLMEKQLFLARLENEFGKGTTWDDEDDDDIE